MPLINRVEFNTGRYYSADGQPITVVIDFDRCYFRDHARMIDASFACDGYSLGDRMDWEIKDIVMMVYDYGTAAGLRYESTYTLDVLLSLD